MMMVACIDPVEGSPQAVRGQRHYLVAREEGESSVQWCCFVLQSERRRHSAHSAGGWCCHRSAVGACSS